MDSGLRWNDVVGVGLCGVAHQLGAGDVHGLDHARSGQSALQAFAQRFGDRAVDGGAPLVLELATARRCHPELRLQPLLR